MIFESSKGKVMAAWPPVASEKINEVFVMCTRSPETRTQSTLEFVPELNLTPREWKEWSVEAGPGGPVTAHPSLLCQSQREG